MYILCDRHWHRCTIYVVILHNVFGRGTLIPLRRVWFTNILYFEVGPLTLSNVSTGPSRAQYPMIDASFLSFLFSFSFVSLAFRHETIFRSPGVIWYLRILFKGLMPRPRDGSPRRD